MPPRRRRPQVAGSPDLAIAPSCTYAAVAVVPTAAGAAEIAVGNVGDSRVYWLPEPPAHAAMPHSRRFRCAGTDHRWRSRRIRSGAGRGAHADPVARRRRRTDAVVGLQRAHRSPSPTAACCWCAPTACGTTCPRPTTSRGSAAETTRPKRPRALVDYALRAGGQDNITVVSDPDRRISREYR